LTECDSMEELLTVDEVAGLLKVNAQTVRNWLDRGELGHVRVGSRRVRIRQSDLDAFLAAGTKTAESATSPVDPEHGLTARLADSLKEATAQLEQPQRSGASECAPCGR
jgi:excisionase family DNA binding protein